MIEEQLQVMVWMGVAKAAQIVALAHLDLGFSELFYFVNNIWRLHLKGDCIGILRLNFLKHYIPWKEKQGPVVTFVANLNGDVVLLFHAGISCMDICLLSKALITFGNCVSLHPCLYCQLFNYRGDFNLSNFEDGVLSSAFMVGLLIASPIFASLAKMLAIFRLVCIFKEILLLQIWVHFVKK